MGGSVEGPIESLAVLPLENFSGDPDQEYFTDGMTEALIENLAKIGALKVISRTSVMRYKDTRKSLPEIARELKVDAIVEGSVLRAQGRVRITAQLIKGETDEHLWAESYERDLRDILSLQSEVARAIAGEIRVKLTLGERERLAEAPAVAPEAHEAYVKGRYFLSRFTVDGARKSLGYFQQAIDIDPGFALAWAGRAGAHGLIAYYGNARPDKAVALAKAAALKAIELDDGLALPHTALGWIKLFEWDWPGAKAAFERALELNPNDAFTHHAYADYLTLMGRAEEGLAHVKRGRDLDPFSPTSNVPVAAHLYMMRRYDEAIAEAQKLLELNPNYPVHGWLALSYWKKGMDENAVAELRKAWRRDPERLEALERGYADAGLQGALREGARLLVARSKARYVGPFNIASLYARAEHVERAFDWLEKAYEQHSPELIYVGVRPDFDALRSDPRFHDLLRRMGLPEDETRSRASYPRYRGAPRADLPPNDSSRR